MHAGVRASQHDLNANTNTCFVSLIAEHVGAQLTVFLDHKFDQFLCKTDRVISPAMATLDASVDTGGAVDARAELMQGIATMMDDKFQFHLDQSGAVASLTSAPQNADTPWQHLEELRDVVKISTLNAAWLAGENFLWYCTACHAERLGYGSGHHAETKAREHLGLHWHALNRKVRMAEWWSGTQCSLA